MKKDVLNAEVLKELTGVDIYCYNCIDSTNNQAKRLINEGKQKTFLVVADSQTAGRGRQGKSFYSPAKTGVYMSYVFHPMADFSNSVSVTTAASVAVCKAIEKLTDKHPEIKWVNDVYLNGKKICGILCEAVTDFETQKVSSVIVGIGVNIKTSDFPDYVENASNLGADVKRADMIAQITRELSEIVSCGYDEFIDYYRNHSMIIGKEIDYTENGRVTHAKAIEIEACGGLTVQLESGEIKTLRSGEISVRRR